MSDSPRLCPDCRKRTGLLECIYFEPEYPGSMTLLQDVDSLPMYCRECYTARGYPYRVVKPLSSHEFWMRPVANLADFPADTRCMYCERKAEVLSGTENILVCAKDSFISYTGRALCKECYQRETVLFYEKIAEGGIEGLRDVRSITDEVEHEMEAHDVGKSGEGDGKSAAPHEAEPFPDEGVEDRPHKA